jgi:hypothetical protein
MDVENEGKEGDVELNAKEQSQDTIVERKHEPPVQFLLILQNNPIVRRIKSDPESHVDEEEVTDVNSGEEDEEENELKCEICYKEFGTKDSLNQHLRNVHGEKKQCPVCSKFYSAGYVNIHMESHELKKHSKAFKCQICSRKFIFSSYLNRHMKIHQQPFECDRCGKTFPQKNFLKDHLQAHLKVLVDPEALKCQICNRTFMSEIWMNQHKRKAHGDGKFQFDCRKCPFTCKSSKILEAHRRKIHLGLFCEACDKTLFSKQLFDSHMKAHKFANGLKCKLCSSEFKSFLGFTFHLRKAHNKQYKAEGKNF